MATSLRTGEHYSLSTSFPLSSGKDLLLGRNPHAIRTTSSPQDKKVQEVVQNRGIPPARPKTPLDFKRDSYFEISNLRNATASSESSTEENQSTRQSGVFATVSRRRHSFSGSVNSRSVNIPPVLIQRNILLQGINKSQSTGDLAGMLKPSPKVGAFAAAFKKRKASGSFFASTNKSHNTSSNRYEDSKVKQEGSFLRLPSGGFFDVVRTDSPGFTSSENGTPMESPKNSPVVFREVDNSSGVSHMKSMNLNAGSEQALPPSPENSSEHVGAVDPASDSVREKMIKDMALLVTKKVEASHLSNLQREFAEMDQKFLGSFDFFKKILSDEENGLPIFKEYLAAHLHEKIKGEDKKVLIWMETLREKDLLRHLDEIWIPSDARQEVIKNVLDFEGLAIKKVCIENITHLPLISESTKIKTLSEMSLYIETSRFTTLEDRRIQTIFKNNRCLKSLKIMWDAEGETVSEIYSSFNQFLPLSFDLKMLDLEESPVFREKDLKDFFKFLAEDRLLDSLDKSYVSMYRKNFEEVVDDPTLLEQEQNQLREYLSYSLQQKMLESESEIKRFTDFLSSEKVVHLLQYIRIPEGAKEATIRNFLLTRWRITKLEIHGSKYLSCIAEDPKVKHLKSLVVLDDLSKSRFVKDNDLKKILENNKETLRYLKLDGLNFSGKFLESLPKTLEGLFLMNMRLRLEGVFIPSLDSLKGLCIVKAFAFSDEETMTERLLMASHKTVESLAILPRREIKDLTFSEKSFFPELKSLAVFSGVGQSVVQRLVKKEIPESNSALEDLWLSESLFKDTDSCLPALGSLRELVIFNAPLAQSGSVEQVRNLAKFLGKANQIRRIGSFGGNSNWVIEALSSTKGSLNKLSHLFVNAVSGVKKLANAVVKHTSLTSVRVGRIDKGDNSLLGLKIPTRNKDVDWSLIDVDGSDRESHKVWKNFVFNKSVYPKSFVRSNSLTEPLSRSRIERFRAPFNKED